MTRKNFFYSRSPLIIIRVGLLFLLVGFSALNGEYFSAWQEREFGAEAGNPNTEADADFFGDGVMNMICFAVAADPTKDSRAFIPKATTSIEEGVTFLNYSWRVSKTAEGILRRVEESNDLQTWSPVSATILDLGDSPDGLATMKQASFPTTGRALFLRIVYELDGTVLVVMPDLLGMSYSEALATLTALGFSNIGDITTSTVGSPPVSVVTQNQAPGIHLPVDTPLTLGLTLPPDGNQFIDIFGEAVIESDSTAIAYYGAVDPGNNKTSLRDWLAFNGVTADPGEVDGPGQPGAPRAEAVYFNEGDLGFGRHMYMHKGIDGNGNESLIYWVTNHADVEAAWQNPDSPIATVAMEYSPDASGGDAYIKFFTFGGYGSRILKIDLDEGGL